MNPNDENMAGEIFGDLICCYTRAEAIEDGVLVDVSERAKRHGIKYPTACTAAVWALIGTMPESCSVDESVRLAAMLAALLAAIRQARGTDRVAFEALGASLWAQCGPGDTDAPVITILREGED